ncbi:hypothetical protein [Catellatospora sp. TT07R-123]|uniref:hypothetical protein n=1 Tax=Catellatospora sp. TT07R-123 TaxID=2733863 RepID=UPI001BB3E108|nr:hypothetical protein [Catellatospora sp. TT07R-123]
MKLLRFSLSILAVAGAALAPGAPAQAAGGGFVRSSATCGSGKAVFSGGAAVNGSGSADFKTSIQESAPGSASGLAVWLSAVKNNDTVSHTLGLYAVCADTPARYQIVRTDVTVAAGGYSRNVATCPGGTVVLGGGAAVVGSGSADFKTSIQESAPGVSGSLSVWLTSVRNNDTVAHTIGHYAVCAVPFPGYHTVSTPHTVAAGGFLRTLAYVCPAGEVILTGGEQVVGAGSGDFNIRLQENAPDSTSSAGLWMVSLRNNGTVARTINVYSVCAPPPAGYMINLVPVTVS